MLKEKNKYKGKSHFFSKHTHTNTNAETKMNRSHVFISYFFQKFAKFMHFISYTDLWSLCVCVCDDCVCGHQALDALDKALQQNPSDLTLRAELYFSKGNQLREMNQLDQAFQVLPTLPPPPAAPLPLPFQSCLQVENPSHLTYW